MLTKNYYDYLRYCMIGSAPNPTYSDGSVPSSAFKSGLKPFNEMTASGWQVSNDISYPKGVCFGTGTAAPALTDYTLEKMITSGLTVSPPSAVSYSQTAKYVEYVATLGVTSETAVTITEIGLFSILTSNAYGYYMIDRTILENPVEIPAGESRQITYTIRFNYPTE